MSELPLYAECASRVGAGRSARISHEREGVRVWVWELGVEIEGWGASGEGLGWRGWRGWG